MDPWDAAEYVSDTESVSHIEDLPDAEDVSGAEDSSSVDDSEPYSESESSISRAQISPARNMDKNASSLSRRAS